MGGCTMIFPITLVPRTVPSLVAWFDANDPAGNLTQPADGSTLTTWFDKSGNGFSATGGIPPYTYTASLVNGIQPQPVANQPGVFTVTI